MSASEHQLLEDLKENFGDFKCTLQDLRNPTEEFVMNFYSYFLQEFEVDIHNVNQAQFSQTSMPYQDAYSAGIPKINMLKSIRAFDIVRDFGLLDIVSPTPKRTQDILRAFVNFYCWSDQRVLNIRDKKMQLNERQNIVSEMRKMREQLRENLNSITKEIPHIQDVKAQLEEELLVLQQNLSEIKQGKKVYKEQVDEMGNKLKEEEVVLQKLIKEDTMVISKIKDLSSQIVSSPSVVLSELEELRQKHEGIGELRDQKRDMVESKMEANEGLEKTLEDQQQRVALLDELLKLIEQLRDNTNVVSGMENNTKTSQEYLTELKASLLAKNNKKQNCQEKLQSLYLKWKALKPQLIENMETALKDLNEKKNAKNKMNTSLKEDAAVQEKIDFNLKRINETIGKVIKDHQNLLLQENLNYKNVEKNLVNNMEDLEKEINNNY